MSFPFFVLERLPRTMKEEREAIRAMSRATYAEPLEATAPNPPHDDTVTPPDLPADDRDDPLRTSPEL